MQTAGLLASLGPRNWQVLSLSQTAGLLGTTISTAGLVSFGASVVALETRDDRPSVYLRTLRARATSTAVIAALLAVGVWWIAPAAASSAVVTGCGALLLGLTGGWYFVGRGEPERWLMMEVLPLAVGTLGGVALAAWLHSPMAFALCYLGGAGVAVVSTVRAVRLDHRPGLPLGQHVSTRAFMREHRGLMAASVAGGVNFYGPAILFAATASPQLATFLLLDRMVKYVLAALGPFLQVLQRWVPVGDPARRRQRGVTALSMAAVAAAMAATLFAALGGLGAQVLSSGTIEATQAQVNAFAVLVGVLIVTQVNALAVIVPLGGRRVLARSTAGGAVALVVVGLVAGRSHGPLAIAWAVVAIEAGILVVQLSVVLRRRVTSGGSEPLPVPADEPPPAL